MQMRRVVLFAMLAGTAAPVSAQVSREALIAGATLAAPEDRREAATVLGRDAAGAMVELRAGTNDLICLADDAKQEGFEANCYHTSLEPFMARGRELTAQGVGAADRTRIRYEEAESGRLKMPERPAILYTLSGSAFDPATSTVTDEYRRTTIYTPYATPETTGLSTKASATDPWIMFPGTPGAHIMITPPRPGRGG